MNRIVIHARVLRMCCLVALAGVAFRPTQAGLIFTFAEVGSDVVMTATGSLDLTNLNAQTNASWRAQDNGVQSGASSNEYVASGVAGDSTTPYTTTFTTAGGSFGERAFLAPSSVSGGIAGFLDGPGTDFVWVPAGYVSGSPLNATSTFNSTTLAGMGLIPGNYTWSWSGSSPDTITVSVVPEPGSLAFFGAAALAVVGFAGARRMRPSRSDSRVTVGRSIVGR